MPAPTVMPGRSPGELRRIRIRAGMAAAALLGLILSLFAVTGGFRPLDAIIHDEAIRRGASLQKTDIVLVTIDEEDLARLGRWPWPRAVHATLVESLNAAGVRAIGMDLLFTEPEQDGSGDRRLAQAIRAGGRVVMPVYSSRKRYWPKSRIFSAEGEICPPLPRFVQAGATVGHILAIPDPDGIVRRMPVNMEVGGVKVPGFAAAVEQAARGSAPRGIPHGSGTILIDYVHPDSFTRFHYRDVLGATEQDLRSRFKGKTVLVGASARGIYDFYYTPLSIHGNPSPGIELHAQTLATIRAGRSGREASQWAGLFLIPLAFVAAWVFTALEPRRSVFVLLGAVFVAIAAFWLLLRWGRIWMPLAALLACLILMYAVALALWFLGEQRARAQMRSILTRYLAPHLAEEVIAHPELLAPGGRRENATVLFADLRGFTAFSESAVPEEVVLHLNRHLDIMARAVLRHGGLLDKFLGDAVMGVFIPGLAGEGYAASAVLAAAEIRSELGMAGFRMLAPGIGVATGEVILGHIGTEERLDYTVIGTAVNLASRLEGIAGPGEILMDSITAARCGQTVECAGEKAVRGLVNPVRIYRLPPGGQEGKRLGKGKMSG